MTATDKIGFRDARYTWTSEDGVEDGSTFSLRIEGGFFFQQKQVNLIYGPTACGKTSLLMAVLGRSHQRVRMQPAWFHADSIDR